MNPLVIDCQYLRPQFAAAFLLKEGAQGAFVENNTAHSVPILLEALKREGLKPEAVQYLMITHVHLDHAGGSSALLKACPNATLLAHPKAATHIIDPSKLIKSARQVYGEAAYESLYGEIEPISAGRVRVVNDGETIPFNSRSLYFFYTRGHANHHFCILDSGSGSIFTGDSFGLAYPALQKNGLLIIPSTSPTDFNADEARLSIRKIIDLKPKKVFLTHFGELKNVEEAANQLLEHLDYSETLMNKAVSSQIEDEKLAGFCELELREYMKNVLERKGLASDAAAWELLKLDIELNAAGIAHVANKIRKRSSVLA